jgi:heme/copper-type cytochrome/quinol oxidase subunit 2
LAKKQKQIIPEQVPTKRQLSKWQRQMKIRRIVIIAAVVFLVGISTWIGYGLYKDYENDPLREVVIKVNDVQFNMEYFVDMLDVYTTGVNSTMLYYFGDYYAGMVADTIISAESLTQAAKEELGIEVTADEINAELKERELPDDKIYRDLIRATLL